MYIAVQFVSPGLNHRLLILHVVTKGFPSGSELKNLPAMQERKEMQVGSLGGEDPLGEGTGNPLQHSCLVSSVRRFATPWTGTCQAPLSVGFLGPEYWSGLPFPSPEDFPGPGIQSVAPVLVCRFFTTEPPGRSPCQ